MCAGLKCIFLYIQCYPCAVVGLPTLVRLGGGDSAYRSFNIIHQSCIQTTFEFILPYSMTPLVTIACDVSLNPYLGGIWPVGRQHWMSSAGPRRCCNFLCSTAYYHYSSLYVVHYQLFAVSRHATGMQDLNNLVGQFHNRISLQRPAFLPQYPRGELVWIATNEIFLPYSLWSRDNRGERGYQANKSKHPPSI